MNGFLNADEMNTMMTGVEHLKQLKQSLHAYRTMQAPYDEHGPGMALHSYTRRPEREFRESQVKYIRLCLGHSYGTELE
ncbi:hypothetical protein RRG08_045573 [Elysia crispata]|uniref:Uncharacterized protein n=1 Tax=Elysia crispata TaxID=231223 RepID=A0AAE1AD48_9GAST|nr:hypothetical protein RRG08_045573 [Elysia crispata]